MDRKTNVDMTVRDTRCMKRRTIYAPIIYQLPPLAWADPRKLPAGCRQ
jgi:hypothetical protein